MTYRGDRDPLKLKEAALARELSALRKREGDVARALDDARADLRNQRTVSLPVLEGVRIASPCSARWEEMTGDARVRFCGKCAKDVYNLSEMTRDEAQALLAQAEGRMCVRLYKRQDGTVITSDCPVGVKKKRVRRVAAVAAAALAGAAGLAGMSATTVMGECPRPKIQQPDVVMGDVASPETAAPTPAPPPTPTAHVVQGTIPRQGK